MYLHDLLFYSQWRKYFWNTLLVSTFIHPYYCAFFRGDKLISWWNIIHAQIAKEHGGIMRYIQVSGLGASPSSPSRMLRAKAAAEEAILRELPEVNFSLFFTVSHGSRIACLLGSSSLDRSLKYWKQNYNIMDSLLYVWFLMKYLNQSWSYFAFAVTLMLVISRAKSVVLVTIL